MKRVALLLVLLALPPINWRAFLREANSSAATKRGVRDFRSGNYEKARQNFSEAATARKTPETAFNRGTSEIAAGKVREGIASLSESATSGTQRRESLFNRGNGYLAAREYDRAIADYEDVLRAQPGNARAKRNLEIALTRKRREQSNAGGGGSGQSSGAGATPQPKPGEQQQPSAQPRPAQQGKETQSDLEALLRSVEQQEKEEQRRLRQVPPERRRIGW